MAPIDGSCVDPEKATDIAWIQMDPATDIAWIAWKMAVAWIQKRLQISSKNIKGHQKTQTCLEQE